MNATEFRNTADEFTKAYLEAALWSSSAELGNCETCGDDKASVDPSTERCAKCEGKVYGTDRVFQDLGFDIEDVAEETLGSIVSDCKAFQEDNAELLERWYAEASESPERAGHDFWLTRNRHGAGFWDRWNSGTPQGQIGKQLTEAAHQGEINLYLGDDRKVYAQ